MDETAIEGRVAAEAMQAYAEGYAAGLAFGRRVWRRVAYLLLVVIVVAGAAEAALWPGMSGG